MNHLRDPRVIPVILCTGCAHPVPAPRVSGPVRCDRCGKRMTVVNIQAVGDKAGIPGRGR